MARAAANARVGPLANLAASSVAERNNCASSWQALINPHSSACSAGNGSLVIIICKARARPTARGTK